MRPHLLIFRFVVVNIVAAGLLGMAALQGWVTLVIRSDGGTGAVFIIFSAFVVGLVISIHRVLIAGRALEQLSSNGPKGTGLDKDTECARPELMAEVLKARLFGRIIVVRQFASALVVLGLVGTVLGFIIALGGVSAEDVGNVATVKPMLERMVRGMSVALYTTLEGSLLGLWLTINYRMLNTGTAVLYSAMLEANGRV